jgi:protein-tyrosine phosphatase
MTRVLFVCTGNICRSPMAEGIFRRMIAERKLVEQFEVDSAGTGHWHVGEAADPRAQAVLERYGANFEHVVRQFEPRDLEHYDQIFVMDHGHLAHLLRRAPVFKNKIRLLMELVGGSEVPDPYQGTPADFERVYGMLEGAIKRYLDDF